MILAYSAYTTFTKYGEDIRFKIEEWAIEHDLIEAMVDDGLSLEYIDEDWDVLPEDLFEEFFDDYYDEFYDDDLYDYFDFEIEDQY